MGYCNLISRSELNYQILLILVLGTSLISEFFRPTFVTLLCYSGCIDKILKKKKSCEIFKIFPLFLTEMISKSEGRSEVKRSYCNLTEHECLISDFAFCFKSWIYAHIWRKLILHTGFKIIANKIIIKIYYKTLVLNVKAFQIKFDTLLPLTLKTSIVSFDKSVGLQGMKYAVIICWYGSNRCEIMLLFLQIRVYGINHCPVIALF